MHRIYHVRVDLSDGAQISNEELYQYVATLGPILRKVLIRSVAYNVPLLANV